MKSNNGRIDIKDYQDLFNSSGFFKHLSSETLSELMKYTELKKFGTHEVILSEGQENRNLYFLLVGELGIYVHGEKVSELKRFGDIVGEISLINATKASATVRAEKDSTVLLCQISEWKNVAPKALREFESTQFKLFAAILAERLVTTNEKARRFEIANKELSEAKEQLERYNTELERRVAERTAELADKNAKLEMAAAENQQLVRVLCHDLNNTLSVMQLTTSRVVKLFEQLTPEQQLESWQRVQRASLKQKDLISHVRELTALESGKKDFQLESVVLSKIIESSLFLFQDKLAEKELILIDNIPDEAVVMAEPVSLTHSVINNLLSNAIKFSPRGRTIEIFGRPLPGTKFELTVKDQGIGIPKEILADLFSMGRKTSRPGTEGESGTGFGMPLVHATMKAYGGSIEVESYFEEKNQPPGTTFKLIFNTL